MICDQLERKLRPLRLTDLLDQRIRRALDQHFPHGWRLIVTEDFKIEIWPAGEAAP